MRVLHLEKIFCLRKVRRLLKGHRKQEMTHIAGLQNLLPLTGVNRSNCNEDLNLYCLVKTTANAKDT